MRSPKLRPSWSIWGELWHFEYFPTTTVRQLLIFDDMTVTVVRIFCCIPNFIKIGSRVSRRPPLLNVHSAVARPVARQRPLPWQPYFGGRVGNVMGCDQPSFVTIIQLLGELWYFQCFTTWRPSALLNFKNFNIWSRDPHCGPNFLLYTKFHQNWFTRLAFRRP